MAIAAGLRSPDLQSLFSETGKLPFSYNSAVCDSLFSAPQEANQDSRARPENRADIDFGLLFLAGVYPVAMDLWHHSASDTRDDMMLSLYFTLGVFLLLAVRSPAGHRSLIAFAGWSSFAHAAVMPALAFQPAQADNRSEFLWGSAVLVIIGALLLALAPAKPSAQSAPVTAT